ncbi:hypothetical protein C8T65DRAFT_58111 [Cerioporus squamosus]|nr:hypothetical protein C8T65DRAFT_58111 [Cerioporus squamosus]
MASVDDQDDDETVGDLTFYAEPATPKPMQAEDPKSLSTVRVPRRPDLSASPQKSPSRLPRPMRNLPTRGPILPAGLLSSPGQRAQLPGPEAHQRRLPRCVLPQSRPFPRAAPVFPRPPPRSRVPFCPARRPSTMDPCSPVRPGAVLHVQLLLRENELLPRHLQRRL